MPLPEKNAIPGEIWLLWVYPAGPFVVSIDEARGGTTYLAAFSGREAIEAAMHQRDVYDVDCSPVLVFPRPE